MRLQIGHGVPPVAIGLFAALFRRSLAAAMHRRRFSNSSAYGGCTPSRAIACSGLQFLRFDACPFEVCLNVILISLLGAP